MKHYITESQLNELSEEGKERLRKWWKPQKGDIYLDDFDITTIECCDEEVGGATRKGYENVLPLLSIGQMIEFLDKYNAGDWSIAQKDGYYGLWSECKYYLDEEYGELCDCLWQAVKEVLNKE